MKIIYWIWQFIAHLAYVITKIDEVFEQLKIFWDFLFGEDPDEP